MIKVKVLLYIGLVSKLRNEMRLKIFGTWLLLMFISQLVTCEVMFAVFKVETKWPGGFEGSVTFPAVKKFPYGWIIYILFDSAVTDLKVSEKVTVCRLTVG